MLKVSPELVLGSLVMVLSSFLLSFRKNWVSILFAVVSMSVAFTLFLLYLEAHYLQLLLD